VRHDACQRSILLRSVRLLDVAAAAPFYALKVRPFDVEPLSLSLSLSLSVCLSVCLSVSLSLSLSLCLSYENGSRRPRMKQDLDLYVDIKANLNN
jgi:hypothetical protein